MLCDDCTIDYPDGCVSMFISSQGNGHLCGICALARKNAVHGTRHKKFNGELAEGMRQAAIRFRAKLQKQKSQ